MTGRRAVALQLTGSDRGKRIGYPLITFAVVAVLWQVTTARMENRLLVPTFTETARSFVELLGTRELWSALATSNQALLIGYVLSIVVGVPLGLALGRFRLLERMTSAYIDLLLVLPVAGLPPLRYRRWRWDVRPDVIDIQHGTFTVRRTLVPLERVQHVDTRRGVLEQIFDLATVVVHTAAGSHTIPYLAPADAAELRDRIAALARTDA